MVMTNLLLVIICKTSGNFFKPRLITTINGLYIKTIAYMKGGPYIFILACTGEVYLIDKKYYNANNLIIDECKLEKINDKFNNEMVKDIACGGSSFLVLTFSKKVYQFNNHIENKFKVINNKIVSISCGYGSNAMITDDGIVHVWTNNVITAMKELTTIKKVACGYMHIMALSNKGNVYTWGSNKYGQLGNGTTQNVNNPIKVQKIRNIVDIATSANHNISIAMEKGNRIFVWGLCLGYSINVPTLTTLSSIHDAFACFAVPKVMHQPLLNNCKFNLFDSLRNAFNDETTSDLTITIHGKSIHVHKSILIFRCQHFREKFLKDPVDEDNRLDENEMLFSYDVYKAFLQYLYTEKIDLPLADTLELIQLADYYSMNQLKRCCVQSLYENITVENVLLVYSLAIKFHNKELEDCCFKFASRKMTAVIRTPNFVELDGSLVKHFIIKAAETHAFRT
ncbi:RCC1 and BTB domain-containing protein 2 isoform X2 [Megalopta genalis]|uniref:RCC1 and BTB domain-containing protein 2 isoform X2 n=1 Tax=Megalopta genalis TaxID=115081 RepID=UPI003FD1B48A